MADEYTPTTKDVRQSYRGGGDAFGAQADAEFDRWIAAHDAEILARRPEPVPPPCAHEQSGIKFDGGRGAVVCDECSRIVTHLDADARRALFAEPVTPETETEWEYAIRTESTGKIEPDTEDGARWTAKYANIGAAGTETYTLMSRPVGPWLPVEDGDENS